MTTRTESTSVYLAPGVYRRPNPRDRPDFRRVRTDIAAFLGYAERGPLAAPGDTAIAESLTAVVRLTGWPEFVSIFGSFIPHGYLAYAVRAFFDNGGTACHVVRVAANAHSDPDQRPREAGLPLPAARREERARLAARLERGDRVLVLDTDLGAAPGDLLELTDRDTEGELRSVGYVAVERVEEGGTEVVLGGPLDAEFGPGTEVGRFDTALRIAAITAGAWGNRARFTVAPLEDGSSVSEFSLRVRVEPGPDRSRPAEEEFYRRLSLDRSSLRYAPDVVNEQSALIRLERFETAAGGLLVDDGPLARGAVRLTGGRDGLSGVSEGDFLGGSLDRRGLRLLEEVDEVAILCLPDAVYESPLLEPGPPPEPPPDPCAPPRKSELVPAMLDPTGTPPFLDGERLYRGAIEQCERLKDRVAVLDTPRDRTPREAVAWRERFQTRFGALYYPWLEVPDPLEVDGPNRDVPPSGHVAGIFARTDNRFGVGRPPANADLHFVTGVVEDIDARQQESLNPYGVNALRAFPGRGIRVWGARSLAGPRDPEWRFIHARRLMSMIQESVEDASQWAVFEVHDDALRRSLRHSLSVFLESIWRQGGLKGALQEEGFYVKCDDTNNPPAVVATGQLVCEVGVAISAPMEFLVFELRQASSGTEIRER